MKQTLFDEIVSEWRKDYPAAKVTILTLENDLRGSAKITKEIWEGTHVPVFKIFDRNPEMPYRFIKGDKIIVIEGLGVSTHLPIYYSCEIVNGVPTDEWWYHSTNNVFNI